MFKAVTVILEPAAWVLRGFSMVPVTIPNDYFISVHSGRAQPYTVWYKRPVVGKKRSVSEVVAFCETWVQALTRVHGDDPDEDFTLC